MKAAVSTVQPLVGTIGERIIAALRARGGLASLDDIKKAIDCSNPTLVEMQLASMRKRGDIYIPTAGYFQFTAAFADAAQPQASAPVQDQPAIDPPSTQEPATMATKECNECHKQKDAAKDFYKGNAKCKVCYNARQQARKTGAATSARAKPETKKKAAEPKARAAAVVEAPVVDEYVIQAAGAIKCKAQGTNGGRQYLLEQDGALIVVDRSQLLELVGWSTLQLKAGDAG